MNDPYLILIRMSISGLAAVIMFRLCNEKRIRIWLLLKSAPIRGRLQAYIREAKHVDPQAVVNVLLAAFVIGMLWAAIP